MYNNDNENVEGTAKTKNTLHPPSFCTITVYIPLVFSTFRAWWVIPQEKLISLVLLQNKLSMQLITCELHLLETARASPSPPPHISSHCTLYSTNL